MPYKIEMPIVEHKLITKHLSIYLLKILKFKNNLTIKKKKQEENEYMFIKKRNNICP
jgi:hypothetical protein